MTEYMGVVGRSTSLLFRNIVIYLLEDPKAMGR